MRNDGITEIYLSVKDCADVLNVKKQAIQKSCKNNKYQVRIAQGNGGMRYEVALSSLPADAQAEYWRRFQSKAQAVSGMVIPEVSEESCSGSSAPDPEAAIYAKLDTYNRKICDRNLAIIHAVGDRKGNEAREYIEKVWNIEHPEESISYKSYQRISADYKKHGISGICGKYGARKGQTKIREDWWKMFIGIYTDSRQSQYQCWRIVAGSALKNKEINKLSEFPSFSTFAKQVDSRMCRQVLTYAREGEDSWKRKHSYSIKVDRDSITAGEIYVGDHRKFDVLVALPDGNLVRPWISAITDYKSGMFLGFDVFYTNPNGDKIILCLKRAFQNFGIPKKILFDNGKDYRRQDIGGGRKSNTAELADTFRPTITGILGIEMHYAIPYNSQSKPIERLFGIMAETFDKMFTSYAGADGKNRPDRTRQIETKMNKIRKHAGESVKNVKFPVIEFDQFEAHVKYWVETFNITARRSGENAGKSPVQIWNEDNPQMRGASTAELGILCASCGEPKSVTRNKLQDSRTKFEYWSPWMVQYEGSDQKFFVRVDPEFPETAYCFKAEIAGYNRNTGEPEYNIGAFINTAKLSARPGMYKDDDNLESELQIKWQIKKEVKYLKNAVGAEIPEKEKLEFQRFEAVARHEQSCETAGVPSVIEPPRSGTITPFSHVPGAIAKEEMNGVWDTTRLVEPKKEEKKNKFKRFVDIEDIEEDQ